MSKSLERVRAALAAAGLDLRVIEMSESTRTAAEAAAAAGCEIDQIAKSILFRGETSGALRLFITAGGNRVDPARAAALAGEPLGKADAAEVRAVTGFAIGGVAPVGSLVPLRSWIDLALAFNPKAKASRRSRSAAPARGGRRSAGKPSRTTTARRRA